MPNKDKSENGRLNTDLELALYWHPSHVLTSPSQSVGNRLILWQTVIRFKIRLSSSFARFTDEELALDHP